MTSRGLEPPRHQLVQECYYWTSARENVNEAFLTLESDLGPHQVIDIPIPDLFFTNTPILVNRSTVIMGISDHDHAVYIDSHITMTRQNPVKRAIIIWGKPDTKGIKETCKELSNSIISRYTPTSDINVVWSCFKDGCQRIIEDNVPYRISYRDLQSPG